MFFKLLYFAMFLAISKNSLAKPIELHPFVYFGGTIVDNSTKSFFVRSPKQRYMEEVKHRQTLGIAIAKDRYGLTLSTNRILNTQIHEQVMIYGFQFDAITKQQQDNLIISYKIFKNFILTSGISKVYYNLAVPKINYQSSVKFYAANVGFSIELYKTVYLLFSYSPHYMNTYKKEHTTYYGSGLIVYFA